MKLKIDLTDPRHIVAAAAFFNSLAGVVPGETLSIEPEAKPTRTRASRAKVKTEEAKTEEVKNQGVLDSVAKDTGLDEAEEGEATLEMLQALVPKLTKVSKHVSLEMAKNNTKILRDKMLELGAKRVSSMTSDKYQEFYDFIQKEFGETLKTIDNAGA